MSASDFVNSMFPNDFHVARRHLPWLIASAGMVVVITSLAGVFFGSRAADQRNALERVQSVKVYAESIERRDALASELQAAQREQREQLAEMRGALTRMNVVLQQLSDNVAKNRAVSRELTDVARHLVVAPAGHQARPQATSQPLEPPHMPPAHRPAAAPPPEPPRVLRGGIPSMPRS